MSLCSNVLQEQQVRERPPLRVYCIPCWALRDEWWIFVRTSSLMGWGGCTKDVKWCCWVLYVLLRGEYPDIYNLFFKVLHLRESDVHKPTESLWQYTWLTDWRHGTGQATANISPVIALTQVSRSRSWLLTWIAHVECKNSRVNRVLMFVISAVSYAGKGF